jgi:hypothetical protein
MTSVTDVPRPTAAKGLRPALVIAVCGSAMAGLVHAAAALGHDGDPLLVRLFVLCAAAQLAWAAVALFRPTRPVLVAGLVINGGALLVWALTRTVGIPFISSLAEAEAAGTQDLVAAMAATASVVGSVRILARPVVRTAIAPVWAGALAIVAVLATLPAMRADHAHGDHTHLEAAGHGDDEHDESDPAHAHDADDPAHAHDADDPAHAHDGDDPAHAHDADDPAHVEGALAGHVHRTTGGSAPHGDDHDPAAPAHPHPSAGPTHPHPTDPHEPTDPTHPHPPADPDDPVPTGPIISLDDPRLTPAQRTIAQGLIDGVTSALRGKTVASIKAAGYQWIGDGGGGGGYQHYVNWSYYGDGIEMDPSRIESIVVKDNVIVSGMYILNPGKTMASVPALAGELTTWHDHQNLCFSGTTLVGLAVNGSCEPARGGPGGVLTPTPPMLHVWLVPHPCGPFAGIETHGGDDTCGHEH